MKHSILGIRELKRLDKPWQEERGPRYGNRRKEIARLKVKSRRQERKKYKIDLTDM